MNTLTGLLVFLAMFLGAAALVWRGLRGRRVGDHPTCRRCGFDLFGAPPDSANCPECGVDVRHGRNVVTGRRQRDAWPFVVAATLLVLVTLGAIGISTKIDWRARLPTWYVLREARTGSAASRVVPIDQLLARDALASLPGEQRLALGRAILALQRDPSKVWKGTWGDWLAQRAIDGALPAAEADTFWQNVLANCAAALRPTIRRGDRERTRISMNMPSGLSSSSIAHARMNTANRTLTLDGAAVGKPLGSMSFGISLSGGAGWAGTSENDDAWTKLAVGPHAVEWACPVNIYAGPMGADDEGRGRTQLAHVIIRWRGTVTVVDGDDVRRVPDPTLADAIRQAITVKKLRLPAKANYSPMLELQLGTFPVDVAFDVFARQGDGPEQKLTTLQREKLATGGSHSIGLSSVKLTPGTATLIFRASADAARSTVELFQIWDGEVRVEDVPVELEP